MHLTRPCPFCAETIQPSAILCRHCGRDLVHRAPTPLRASRRDHPSGALSTGVVIGVAVAVATVVGFNSWGGMENIPDLAVEELPLPVPLVLSLLDEPALQIPAGGFHNVSFHVEDERQCILTGRVLGLAGGNHDLEVYVFDQDGLINFTNRTAGHALFRSGRTSAATIEVALPGPGKYNLLVSNRFSVVTGKVVQVQDAKVTCG